MANTLLIIKDGSNKFWHRHNGLPATDFIISDFSATLDGNKFNIVQNDGAVRFTYLVENITIQDNTTSGTIETFFSPIILWNRLIAIQYTPFFTVPISGLSLNELDAIHNSNAPTNSNPFATMDDITASSGGTQDLQNVLTRGKTSEIGTVKVNLGEVNDALQEEVSFEVGDTMVNSKRKNDNISISDETKFNDGVNSFTHKDLNLAVQVQDGYTQTKSLQVNDGVGSGSIQYHHPTPIIGKLIRFFYPKKSVSGDYKLATQEEIPTLTSELTNDSGFITASDIPINEPLGLIRIEDLAGELFTDLASGLAYLQTYTDASITDASFNNGVLFFTLPQGSGFGRFFLSDFSGNYIDSLGLVTVFADQAFKNSTGNIEVGNILLSNSTDAFAPHFSGKFIINGNIGIDETATYPNLFVGSTAVIWAKHTKRTSDSGHINGNLLTAQANGAKLFFQGVEIYDKVDKESGKSLISDSEITRLSGVTNFDNSGNVTALASKADLVGGLVPSSQLPSFVDDVLEFSGLASFPTTGESGKIYLAIDTNKSYRWSGSTYVHLDDSIALGETSATAYRGDRGKTAYDHSQATGNPHGATTDNISEGSTNKYWTNARTIASTITGFVAGSGTVVSTDTILQAIQKIVGNINSLVTGVSSVNTKTGSVVLTTADIADSTGKRYQTESQNTFNDATSSIQTQLNNKYGYLVKDVIPSAVVTGTLSETLTGSYKINANTFSSSDMFYLLIRMERTIFTGSGLLRVRLGTTSTFSTSLPLLAYTNTSSASPFSQQERDFKIYNGNIEGLSNIANGNSDKTTNSAAKTQTPFINTNDYWIFVSIANAVLTDNSTQSMVKILK